MSSVHVSPERYTRIGTLPLDACAGMKILKFVSRFPNTVDFQGLSFSILMENAGPNRAHLEFVLYKISVKDFVGGQFFESHGGSGLRSG